MVDRRHRRARRSTSPSVEEKVRAEYEATFREQNADLLGQGPASVIEAPVEQPTPVVPSCPVPVVELAGVSRIFGVDPPVHALRERRPVDLAGRVGGHRRPVRVGEVDAAQRPRPARPPDRGHLPPRRRRRRRARRPRAGPACGAGASASSSSPSTSCPTARVLENVMLAELYVGAPRAGPAGAGHGGAGPGRAGRPGRLPAHPAVGRPAAAGGDRPGAHGRAEPAAVRRADRATSTRRTPTACSTSSSELSAGRR